MFCFGNLLLSLSWQLYLIAFPDNAVKATVLFHNMWKAFPGSHLTKAQSMGRKISDAPVLALLGGFAEKDFNGERKAVVGHWKLYISLKK